MTFFSLHKDISHGIVMFVAIISSPFSLVSTRVGVIRMSSSTKPDSGITPVTMVSFVTKDTDSCFGKATLSPSVEAFLVTVRLQGSFRPGERLPRVPSQRGGAVLSVGNQWVQGISLLIYDNKIELLADLHTEADFGERCVPEGRQLGLLCVEPSLPSCKVEGFLVSPKAGIIVEGWLRVNNNN